MIVLAYFCLKTQKKLISQPISAVQQFESLILTHFDSGVFVVSFATKILLDICKKKFNLSQRLTFLCFQAKICQTVIQLRKFSKFVSWTSIFLDSFFCFQFKGKKRSYNSCLIIFFVMHQVHTRSSASK